MVTTNKTKTINLITCDNITEAYFIKNRLNNEGVDCFLTNQNFTNLMPIYNNMLGSGIQIFVMESDYEKSRKLIKDKLDPEKVELICPNCGSNQINLGLGKHKILKAFNILLAILILIPLGNIKPKYYCSKCKSEIK